jgi:hypothetical protein
MKKAIIICCSLFFLLNVFGNTEKNFPNNKSNRVTIADSIQSHDLSNNENPVYKMLYDETRMYNSKLLSLLQAAFGILIAVILAILGSSIFYNYRFNKKEYELLNKESRRLLEESQVVLIEKSREEINKLIEKLNNEIDKKFTGISETYKVNYEAIKDSINTIILSFKSDIDKHLQNSMKDIIELKEENKKLNENIEKGISTNEKSIRQDLYEIRGMLYTMREWYSLALSSYISKALLCIELGQTWFFEYVADDIISSIEKCIEKKETITPYNKTELEKVLSGFPEHLKDRKMKIEKEYKKIEVKEINLPKRNIYPPTGLLGGLFNSY